MKWYIKLSGWIVDKLVPRNRQQEAEIMAKVYKALEEMKK